MGEGGNEMIGILVRIGLGGGIASILLGALKLLGLVGLDWWAAVLPLLGGLHILVSATLAFLIVLMIRTMAQAL